MSAVACTTDQTVHGEGVRWDARRGELLRVDTLTGRVYRDHVDDDGGLRSVHVYELQTTVGAISPIWGDDGWLLAAGTGVTHLSPDGATCLIAQVVAPGVRMIDASCDPHGRCWAGTLTDDHRKGGGALHRIDGSGHVETVLDGLTSPSGIGWSPDGETMYVVDGGPRVVMAFAFDTDHGSISAGRILLSVPEHLGRPDGMTVDAAGDLWVAVFGGGCVQHYTPAGVLLEAYPIPARRTTSCAFAGQGLHDLYVTTASEGPRPDGRATDRHEGLVYRVPTSARGVPAAPFVPDPTWWYSAVGRPDPFSSDRRGTTS
jgi:sugar lactone lactonase YvrE